MGEDLLSGGRRVSPAVGDFRPMLPCEFPFDLGSEWSSPVESLAGTESEEEEVHLAGLTRQMAHSFLDDGDVAATAKSSNPKVMSTSPQSTLSGYGLPSAISPPSKQQRDIPWDLLCFPPSGVRHGDDRFDFSGRGLLGPVEDASVFRYYAAQQQIRYEELKRQQLLKQRLAGAWAKQQSRASAEAAWVGRTLGLPSSAWPPLQSKPQPQPQPQPHQQPQPPRQQGNVGQGMRVVFLNDAGNRRTSSGTGVFLPQRSGAQADARKKPACSTVLLPARVVQALNLNLEEITAHPRVPGTFILRHDAPSACSNYGAIAKQKQLAHLRSQPLPSPAAVAEELQLPAEWTY